MFSFGSSREGGKQAAKKKPKRRSQLAHTEAFPRRDALFLLPKPVALPHPTHTPRHSLSSSSYLASPRAAGYLLGARCHLISYEHPPLGTW